jgi:hypothetical protein
MALPKKRLDSSFVPEMETLTKRSVVAPHAGHVTT